MKLLTHLYIFFNLFIFIQWGLGTHCLLYSIFSLLPFYTRGPSWPWSYGSWIYNYLCNQCLSPL